MKRFIFGCDEHIAAWAFKTFNFAPVQYNMAVGIVENDQLLGAVIFHACNGFDVEVSYYGPKTMTLGIIRGIAHIAVNQLGVCRITVRTARNNKTMTRGIKKIGFEYEGIRKHGYGSQDAVMYGLYGKNLARLARKEMH
jgi:hypothetical protein